MTILLSVATFSVAATIAANPCRAERHRVRVVNDRPHPIQSQGTGADVDPHPKRTIDLDGAPAEGDQVPVSTNRHAHLWNNTFAPPPDPGPEVVQDPIRFHVLLMGWLAFRLAVKQPDR